MTDQLYDVYKDGHIDEKLNSLFMKAPLSSIRLIFWLAKEAEQRVLSETSKDEGVCHLYITKGDFKGNIKICKS